MKYFAGVITLAFVISCYFACIPQGKLIDKDKRVVAVRDSIVRKLSDEQEFDRGHKAAFQYYNRIYITKRLEIFDQDLLLVKFGTRSSRTKPYWGLLKKGKNFLFHYAANDKDNHADLLSYLNSYDSKTRGVILEYLRLNALND
jgi:hypothetical protein